MNGRTEIDCENTFRRMGQVFNANTPENHPIVFKTEDDYKTAMSILAISARMFHGVTIYAFQVMSNHLHLVVGGEEREIQGFFSFFVGRLDKHFGGAVDLSGFVVNNNVTPFSYPWGSSGYFFQPAMAEYDKLVGKPIGFTALRTIMHSRACDHLKDLKCVKGYVSPLEFCHVAEAESAFRDAKQYFYSISKNVEVYSDVAKSIGESIFYTDNDLYCSQDGKRAVRRP